MGQIKLFEDTELGNAEGSLTISYTGEATESYRINTELYARSILGFDKAFKRACKKLLDIDVVVNMRAEAPGSFEAFVEFFSQKQVIATATFCSLFGLFQDRCYLDRQGIIFTF